MTERSTVQVEVFPDLAALSAAAAARLVAAAHDAVAARGRFVVVLAGGGTPRALYELLARAHGDGAPDALPWARTHVWFGDERCVPPDDAASNFRMAHEALLARVPLDAAYVHRMEGEREPADAAARYEAALRAFGGAHEASESADAPVFDVVLLGMGADGHTASLFPGSPALDETARWVVPAEAPPGVTPQQRLTLTLPALGASRTVLVLAAGAEKREPVRRALAGAGPVLPVARVRGRESTVWLLDRAAAGPGIGQSSP